MTEPRVLVREEGKKSAGLAAPDPRTAWKWIGWLGFVLAVVGLWDFALTWYPLRFGSAEWEFATVAASYSGLPLATMGLMAMAASAIARRVRWQVIVLSVFMLLFGVSLLAGFLLFMTTVPMALRAVEGVALIGIRKAVAKTAMLAVMFGGAYLVAGIAGFRTLRRSKV